MFVQGACNHHAIQSGHHWELKKERAQSQHQCNGIYSSRVRTCLKGAEGGGDEDVRCDKRLHHSPVMTEAAQQG